MENREPVSAAAAPRSLPRRLGSGVVRGLRRSAFVRALASRVCSHSDPAPASVPTEQRFDAEAFRKREQFRENYSRIAFHLADLLAFDSVLDLGCANGFLMEEFDAAGKAVTGVELSPECLEFVPPRVRGKVIVGDAVALGRIGTFDLVCCVEVAEHVPPASSTGLVETICANAGRWIYFTAASPFQPGHGHINCRQQFFWLNQFRKLGVEIDWDMTERFLARIDDLRPAVWLPMNSLVLRRIGAAAPVAVPPTT